VEKKKVEWTDSLLSDGSLSDKAERALLAIRPSLDEQMTCDDTALAQSSLSPSREAICKAQASDYLEKSEGGYRANIP